MQQHNIVSLLRSGVCVTVNSDDPTSFGGYMNDNFYALANAHELSKQEIAQFSINAINASFIAPIAKEDLISEVRLYAANH